MSVKYYSNIWSFFIGVLSISIISPNKDHDYYKGKRDKKRAVKYSTKQGRCLAQTSFAAFVEGVQLISRSAFDETEQLFRLTSSSGILATS